MTSRTKTRVAALAVFMLLNITIVFLWTLTGWFYYVSVWYGPSLELTYELPRRKFPECETTTESWDDLTVDENTTKEEAAKIGEVHAAAMVRGVLTKETAEMFRDYSLKANQELPEIALRFPADTHPHRYHIIPPPSEPAVQKLFKELAEHPVLRKLVDSLLGEDSSLVNFSVLTSEYGAKEQPWHTDAGMSAELYPEYFVKEYTLVVAMQDTNKDMGATGLCPGMRPCNDEEEVECPMQAAMSQGDVFLYSSDVYHAGMAHEDPNSPARVFAFITFAESPQGPDDRRRWAVGTDRLLDWRMFGHTFGDLATMKERPWRLWHVLGLFNKKEGNVRPWNLIDYFLQLYVDRNHEMPSIVEGVWADDMDMKVFTVVWYFGIFIAVYLLVFVPVVVLAFANTSSSKTQSGPKQNGGKTTKTD